MLLRARSGALGALVGLVEEHLAEDVVVDLQPRHRRRSLLLPAPHHDGVCRRHLNLIHLFNLINYIHLIPYTVILGHLGLLLADVEGDGVDEGPRVHLVVIHGAAVPDLVRRTVVDVRKVTANHFAMVLRH